MTDTPVLTNPVEVHPLGNAAQGHNGAQQGHSSAVPDTDIRLGSSPGSNLVANAMALVERGATPAENAPAQRFVLEQRMPQIDPPRPSQWWRRLLRLGPSAEDLAAQDRSLLMQANFGRPITIMVATPKGGSGKTPTARCLAAAFASARGGGVVVLDNNELRGTLASRSLVTHEGNLGDVLRSSAWFLSRDASVLALEQTMHRQPDSHEWVLGSDPNAPEPLTGMQYRTVHDILEHFFSIIVVDTGNNERAQNWMACAGSADLLVVPMKWRYDHIGPAAHMLDEFARNRPDMLARTVIVSTNGPGDVDPVAKAEGLRLFSRLPIIEIPTDVALTNTLISWPRLHPHTRRAYEQLAVQLCDLAPTPERN